MTVHRSTSLSVRTRRTGRRLRVVRHAGRKVEGLFLGLERARHARRGHIAGGDTPGVQVRERRLSRSWQRGRRQPRPSACPFQPTKAHRRASLSSRELRHDTHPRRELLGWPLPASRCAHACPLACGRATRDLRLRSDAQAQPRRGVSRPRRALPRHFGPRFWGKADFGHYGNCRRTSGAP
jgi:hypothetical protein